jgi:hypothetical protein
MKPASMKPVGVKSTAVEAAAVEAAAVKTPAATVKTPATTVPSAPAAMRCVGEIRLAENSRAQQYSSNAHHTPPFAGPGSVIA